MQWPQICRLAFAVMCSSWAGNFFAFSLLSVVGDQQNNKEASKRKNEKEVRQGREGNSSSFYLLLSSFLRSASTTESRTGWELPFHCTLRKFAV